MSKNPMLDWVQEVADDELVICPDDVVAEARGNRWLFSLSRAQAARLSPADVAEFAAGVVEGRRAQLVRGGHPPMTMYWWHDEQAGQLRFSMMSAVHKDLPFGCIVVPAATLEDVAQAWLSSSQGLTPWGELEPVSPDDPFDTEPPPYVLPVWSIQLP